MNQTSTQLTIRALKDINQIEKYIKEIKRYEKMLKKAKAIATDHPSEAGWYAEQQARVEALISVTASSLLESCSAVGCGDNDDWDCLGHDIAKHLTK